MLFSGFSWQLDYLHYRISPKGAPYFRTSTLTVDLPAVIDVFVLIPSIPSEGGSVTPASPHHAIYEWRNINRLAIAIGVRLRLRTRLTRGRLTSPRKPWPCGEGASYPLYRYLYLHLLFLTLQHDSQHAFYADRNAPLPMLKASHGFGTSLHTRLLSTPSSLTSELLRTL